MDIMEIHDQYYHRVRKYILAQVRNESVADDLIQETFVRIQANLDGMRDLAKLSSWIFRIAHNLCLDHFRASKNTSVQEEIGEGLIDIEKASLQKQMEQNEMSKCVRDKLNLLPEAQRSVLIFSDIMEFSDREIADILGLSLENVKVTLHRARKKLKAILEKECRFEVDERSVLVCEPVDQKNRR